MPKNTEQGPVYTGEPVLADPLEIPEGTDYTLMHDDALGIKVVVLGVSEDIAHLNKLAATGSLAIPTVPRD